MHEAPKSQDEIQEAQSYYEIQVTVAHMVCFASFFSQPWNNYEKRMISMHVKVPSIYCKQLDKIWTDAWE